MLQTFLRAVAELKKLTDLKDKFHTFKTNCGTMNNTVGYMFRSSKVMAKVVIQMDIRWSDHPLQNEECFFDEAQKRFKGYKTLTLWVFIQQ